eukprot:234033_1
MASFLRGTRNYKPKGILYHTYRNYFTGSRYSGYVNYFHNENLFGFVVREDAPEREYYFHVTDLHAENIPRVRPLQSVEFSIIEGRGGNFMARDISSLGGQPLRYAHANMKMNATERNRLLSELPNSEMERHTGVVVSVLPSGKGGLIVPDRLNFAAIGYSTTEIQSSGAQRIERFAEVEFFARPSKHDRKDRAVCVTRRGGGLITAERRNTGHSRRLLGAMYGPNDLNAHIPKDFAENRRRGYVVNYNREKLYGFIVPFDEDGSARQDGYFVHIDDCHVYGARFLKRFQEVEFSVVTDQSTGKSKALHVCGPNKTVLRSVSENRYIPTNLANNKLSVGEDKRHRGSIMVTSPAVNWFIIKPDDKGYEAVIAYKNNVQSLGHRRLQLDDCLEFNVLEPSEQHEGGLLRAANITAPSGRPILCEQGPLGKYLQGKMNLSCYQSELAEYDMSSYNKGTVVNGFITNYSTQHQFGQIEIESPDANIRYRRCYFKLDDAALPAADLDLEHIFIRDGTRVQFELQEIDYSVEFEETNRRKIYDKKTEEEEESGFHYEEVEPTVHIKAVNVVSNGLDFLEVSEAQRRQPIADTGSGFGQTQQQERPALQLDVEDKKDKEDIEDEPLFGGDEFDDDEPLFGDEEEHVK